jgi:hypothetical protein
MTDAITRERILQIRELARSGRGEVPFTASELRALCELALAAQLAIADAAPNPMNMRQSWIDYMERLTAGLAKRALESCTLTLILTNKGDSVSVNAISHQCEDAHLLEAARFLISTLAHERPELEIVAKLQAHFDSLLGGSATVINPSQVN